MTNIPEFIDSLTEKGVKISVDDGRLICDAPKGVIDQAMAQEIRDNKQAVIDYISEQNSLADMVAYSASHRHTGNIPITQSQERLLFLEHLMKGTFAANLPLTLKFTGRIHIEAFRQSLQTIVDRHSILRTTFRIDGGATRQDIHPSCPVELKLIDLSVNKETQVGEYEALLKEEIGKHFDFSVLPLFRFFLIKLNDDENIFFFVKPSIIWDGWSYDVFLNELNQLYGALSTGKPSPLSPLRLQYSDYSIWHRKWVEGYEVKRQIDYWKKKLPSRLPKLKLPFDRKRPSHFIYKGGHQFVRIPVEDIERLKHLCKKDNLTLFIGFLTVLKILLFRYTDTKDIIIGMPMWNRVRPEMEELIGHFVNNILLLTKIRPHASFRQTMKSVHENFIEVFSNQEAPFEKLVEQLNLIQGRSRDPIYQVFFSYQDARNRSDNIGDLSVKQLDSHNSSVSNDISFWLKESDHDIVGAIDYSTDLFNEDTVKRFLDHFLQLLKSCLDNPDKAIYQLGMLTETDALVSTPWTETKNVPSLGQSIPDMVRAIARKDPGRIAAVQGSTKISYGELDSRTDVIAQHIKKKNLPQNACVAVFMAPSMDAVGAVLGILKSGNGFVLINPCDPSGRIHQRLARLKPDLCVVQPEYAAVVRDAGTDSMEINALAGAPESRGTADAVDGKAACVFYTTMQADGIPKRGWLTHEDVLAVAESAGNLIHVSDKDAYYCDHGFFQGDGVLSLIVPLVWGCTLIIDENHESDDPVNHAIDTYHPTIIHSCFENMGPIAARTKATDAKIIYSGNRCPDYVERDALKKSKGLWYLFGYPETSFWNGYDQIGRIGNVNQNIRGMIGGTRFYVLDAQQQFMPAGALGKLYAGGFDLTHIVGSPDATATDSGHRSCTLNNGESLFFTGDTARWLMDGSLELSEANNDYCRIYGDRLPLRDVEECMERHPKITGASVIAISKQNEQRIIGFYASENGADVDHDEIRNLLVEFLPAYLVPMVFVHIDEWPGADQRSMDKEWLANQFIQSVLSDEDIVDPGTETEKKLAGIWSKLLNIKRIGINQVFFDLGGHSLLAVGLFAKINEAFGIDLPLATLFNNPTIKGIASRIDAELYINYQRSEDNSDRSGNEDFEI